MFHPVSLVLVCGVIVVCCLICVLVFIIRLCGSTVVIIAFLPKKKKKIALFASLVVVTIGVVTYGIRAGSTHDLGSLRISLI
jgi:hypothetical protein